MAKYVEANIDDYRKANDRESKAESDECYLVVHPSRVCRIN